jgi:hypothetical protein
MSTTITEYILLQNDRGAEKITEHASMQRLF